MRGNKRFSKAFIECLFMHKPASLCIHFFSDMLYNVDVRMLLSNTRQCRDRQHKWVIEITERYENAASRRIHGHECSLIFGQHGNMFFCNLLYIFWKSGTQTPFKLNYIKNMSINKDICIMRYFIS